MGLDLVAILTHGRGVGLRGAMDANNLRLGEIRMANTHAEEASHKRTCQHAYDTGTGKTTADRHDQKMRRS